MTEVQRAGPQPQPRSDIDLEHNTPTRAHCSKRASCKAIVLGALACGGPVSLVMCLANVWNSRLSRTEVLSPHGQALTPPPRVWCQRAPGEPACPASILPLPRLQSYLAACVVLRDELDVPEWLAYHRRLGIGAFYIYDHNGTMPLTDTVPYASLAAGDVRYTYFNQYLGESPQLAVYNECREQFFGQHRWMTFIDPDEFIVLQQPEMILPKFLAGYEEFGALVVNWRLFGSSNHTHRPAGRVVDNYIHCYPRDHSNSIHVKVIANTRFTHLIASPHQAEYVRGKFAVTESRQPHGRPETPLISMNEIALYHYVVKSQEDFDRKRARGAVHGVENIRPENFLQEVDSEAVDLCDRLVGSP
jgi:hypothetical protein